MSHVKNVAAFEKLLGYCSGYGGSYNPGLKNLTVSTMSDLLEKARQAVQQANATKSSLDNETNQREILFDNLPKLVSGIVFTLAASGASEQTMKDARVFFRHITGRKLIERQPIPSDASSEVALKKLISRRGYISDAGQFAKLVQMISDEPLYQPNEPHLNREGLKLLLEKMNSLNTSVANYQVAWSNARMELNKELYSGNTSLHSTAGKVRKYVRGAYGLKSSQYSQLKTIDFTKPV